MRKTLLWLFLACSAVCADDDHFRERFADPATRTAALAELIPGTQAAFFHTALDHQLAGRDVEFRKVMGDWKIAAERKEHPVGNTGMSVLENRQLLLDYKTNPVGSLAEMIRRLDLKFDDARPDVAAAESLPTRLDAALVVEEVFEKTAAEKSPESPYRKYQEERLLRELEQLEKFDDAKIRWFLEHLQRADLPGVVPLIDRALALENPPRFGSLPIFDMLTSQQLEMLAGLHPELRSSKDFGIDYLTKLRPGVETDFNHDPKAHAAYLQKCRDFAMTLPPAMNSLKAHVLFHHLRLQAELGNFPKDDFLAYLALPQTKHDYLKLQESASPATVNQDADFTAATACPPIHDDSLVVEDYLNHFLSDNDSSADFSPFIRDKELAQLHAKARLLVAADPARWAPAFDPEDYRKLQEEVRIGFPPGRPKLLDAGSKVSLTVDLKNTPDLLIRIYELDLPTYYASHSAEPDAGIDLDGLVPHAERRLVFAQAPIVAHREAIDLPELEGPGAWLVDLTGGQVSARALIRKGRLIPYTEQTASGHIVRIFGQDFMPVMDASIRLGNDVFSTDGQGRITIPDAPNQPVKEGLVQAGKLAMPFKLDSRDESLSLDARFHLEREQILADQEARLHLRVRLTNNGHELPLDRIKEPALVMKAELLGGITTERVVTENLTLAPSMEIPFQVPAGLLKLTLTLRGSVTPALGGETVKLSADQSFETNGDLNESRIGTAFFSPTAEGHRLEVRGRNGEALPSRALVLTCRREGYDVEVKSEVRTDAQGRVDLGTLEGIDTITASGEDIAIASYKPELRKLQYASVLTAIAGEEVRLPLEIPAAAPDRGLISLLETSEGRPLRDHFEKLSVDGDQLVIRGLPAGDFELVQGDHTSSISVSSGVEKDGLLISNNRIMPRHSPSNPVIAQAVADPGELRVQLKNFSATTRVSLIGKRYKQRWNPGQGLYPFSPPKPPLSIPGFAECAYLTDRRLGDEMRYILDRRAAKTFSGVMLPRPGVLLNRWTEEDVDQSVLPPLDGAKGKGSGGGFGRGSGKLFGLTPDNADGGVLTSVSDFLEFPAVVRFDIKPEADGMLKLPIADFHGSQFIEIVATDLFASDSVLLPLPANDTPLRDRRIARPLDPQAHHVANRSATVLQKGGEAAIENVLDADWRAFTTLTDAHEFLFGMTGDDRLREFVFLTTWPDLTDERKLELLSQHACHELHLFLARKDPAFFTKYVRPMLAEKPEPQFMDDLLLQRDLTAYLRPYAWQRLNAAEKALLSQAMPAVKARIARELSSRWELEAPDPESETKLFARTLGGSDLALQDSLGLARKDLEEPAADSMAFGAGKVSSGVSYVAEKLRTIVIPSIDFEDTTVEEAIDFLRQRTTELDPAKEGLNFVIRRPRNTSGDDPGALRIKELRIRNVPLAVALKYICEQTKLRYKVDDFAVTLVPQTESGDDIFTRSFGVPPDFAASLDGEGGSPEADPFAPTAQKGAKLSVRASITELLKRNGITFAEGSSATLVGGRLLVTNSSGELDKIEQLTSSFHSEPKSEFPVTPATPTTSEDGDYAPPELPNSMGILPDLPDPFASADEGAARLSVKKRPLLFPEQTRLWREANYYKNTKPTDERLIPLNRFWLDLAAWDGKGSFLSSHFNECHTSGSEALMCLALLDLPFKADRPEVKVDGSTLRVKAREPMLLFYKDTRRTENVAQDSPLLLRQSFSPLAEPTRIASGHEVENSIVGAFRPGVAYRTSLVVTNPTGVGRRIDVLAQIPAGAIPLQGQPETLSSTHEIKPYGVLMLELAFYFPAVGEFAVYPMHVSENGIILARTDLRTLHVTTDPEPRDAASWGVLASEVTDDEVLVRLAAENLKTLDLTAIRWRLKNPLFFNAVRKILQERLYFSSDVASFGFLHNDLAAIHDYLENSGAATRLGRWLDSPLLEIRPRTHLAWETLEFDPLVNPRAHRFGDNPRMTHEAARKHYQNFLDQLGWKTALDAEDQLSLTVLLLLQDRVEEALARFDQVDPAKLPGHLQYDYLHAVVLFHREQALQAKEIAVRTLPALPPGLWRDRFQTVVEQADEIAALDGPDENARPADEKAAPQLELAATGGGKLTIQHRATDKASLRLFSVDLEVLFSKNPFAKDGGGDNAQPVIQPNASFDVAFAKDATETTIEMPPALRQGNVLVSAESGSAKLLKVIDSRALEIRYTPLSRSIQVMDAASAKPLPKTYVKVYVETRDGEVIFHKDGYTDLRGKFDYLSHTGTDVSRIKRVAILVSHPVKGARTAIYDR